MAYLVGFLQETTTCIYKRLRTRRASVNHNGKQGFHPIFAKLRSAGVRFCLIKLA